MQCFFFQAEDGIRDFCLSRGLGDVYKRQHTAGSQLLEVPTSIGKLVFGSDAYSSWEAIRDWMTANVQQTDTVQQFLAYEKCYKITGGYQNCVSAHETPEHL